MKFMFEYNFWYIYLILIIILCFFMAVVRLLIKYMKRNKNVIKVNKDYYYRDIPCYGSIRLAFWLLSNFSNMNRDELNNGLIGAYLLKWFKEGYIDIKSISNKDYVIDLKSGDWTKTYFEQCLYNFLKKVSGNNNLLEKNEIKRYCSIDNNRFQLEFLVEYALSEIRLELEEMKEIETICFNNNYKFKLSEEIKNEYKNLIGLKNFLVDFSNIEEKRHIEIHLWEDYLLFANVLGIADEVKKQFKNIYPDNEDINNAYLISFDGTLISKFRFLYNVLKLNLLIIFGFIFLIIFTYFGLELIYLFLCFLFIFIYFIYRYWVNRKVKEMNGIVSAKITKVVNDYDIIFDGSNFIIRKYHLIDYEYQVNNILYNGDDCFQRLSTPKVGDKIKIYYNLLDPSKSESSLNHNKYLKYAITFFIVILIILYLCLKIYL